MDIIENEIQEGSIPSNVAEVLQGKVPEVETKKLKKDILNEKPKLTLEEITSGRVLKRWFKKKPKKELEEPLLFIFKSGTSKVEIEQGAKEGLYRTSEDTGTMLDRAKLRDIVIGDNVYSAWFIDERSFTPLPYQPKTDSEIVYKALQRISINYREMEENIWAGKSKFLMTALMGGAVALVLLWNTGILAGILSYLGFDGGATTTAVAQTVVNNTTEAVVNTGLSGVI